MNCLAGEKALRSSLTSTPERGTFSSAARRDQDENREYRYSQVRRCQARRRELIQPILLSELFGKVALGQILKILVGEGIELKLESRGEHPFDFILPLFFLKPLILHYLYCPIDVFVVELDANVARKPVAIGIGAGEADELGLGDGHALAFKSEINRSLFDDRVDVVAPRIVIDENVNGKIVFFVQPARQAPDTAGRLAVSRKQDTVVPAPEFIF